MERYNNLSGHSGVIGYEIGHDFITVYFRNETGYVYTARSVGAENLAEMCRLARAGEGLSAFISRVVWDKYEKRL